MFGASHAPGCRRADRRGSGFPGSSLTNCPSHALPAPRRPYVRASEQPPGNPPDRVPRRQRSDGARCPSAVPRTAPRGCVSSSRRARQTDHLVRDDHSEIPAERGRRDETKRRFQRKLHHPSVAPKPSNTTDESAVCRPGCHAESVPGGVSTSMRRPSGQRATTLCRWPFRAIQSQHRGHRGRQPSNGSADHLGGSDSLLLGKRASHFFANPWAGPSVRCTQLDRSTTWRCPFPTA